MRGGELVAVRRTFDSNVSLRSRDAGARVLVTPLGAVVAECVSTVGLVDAVVLADAVRARGVSVADELPPGRSNARQRADLRRVVALSDAGAESAMESRTRLLLTLVGLRGMVSQHVIVTAVGHGESTWHFPIVVWPSSTTVARALRSQGADVRLVDAWRLHFPQRAASAA